MAKDPAFLFYPGDYLRDTQCLSESVQVAYDRIMCEHMRNICITYEQLNFFTKRLSDAEKSELLHVLSEVEGGYQIGWVAESISKRKDYSESRRKNRSSSKKDMSKTSSTYVKHMENEIENEIVIENKDVVVDKNELPKNFPFTSAEAKQAWRDYMTHRKQLKIKSYTEIGLNRCMEEIKTWGEASFIESVYETIKSNWQGLFPPKHKSNGTTSYKKPLGRTEPPPRGTPAGQF